MSLSPDVSIEPVEDISTFDDWGDFSAVIDQLEAQEQGAEEGIEPQSEPVDNSTKIEMAGDLLGALFNLSEKAISHTSGVAFTFNEADKVEVIEATKPVLEMHSGEALEMLGDYIPYAALLLAVVGLVYSSKQRLAELKAAQALEQGGKDGKEESATAQAA